MNSRILEMTLTSLYIQQIDTKTTAWTVVVNMLLFIDEQASDVKYTTYQVPRFSSLVASYNFGACPTSFTALKCIDTDKLASRNQFASPFYQPNASYPEVTPVTPTHKSKT